MNTILSFALEILAMEAGESVFQLMKHTDAQEASQ